MLQYFDVCCVVRQQDGLRLLTQGVVGTSSVLSHAGTGVVTVSDDVSPSVVGTRVAVVNMSTLHVTDNGDDAATTKLTSSVHTGRQCHCVASGCRAPPCAHAATFQCRLDYAPPNIVDASQRSTSAMPWNNNSPTTGSTGCDVVEAGGADMDDEDDEACTTTSGSYSAGDLCDDIDQLFFVQNCNKMSTCPPNDAFNLSN